MGGELVELVVLLVGDAFLRFEPEGFHRVDALAVEQQREADEVRVLLDDLLHRVLLGEVRGVFFEMQHDFAATSLTGSLINGVAARAIAGPDEVLAFVAPGMGVNLDFVRHHEGGVKTHAELADERGVVLLARVLQSGGEGLRAAVGDGAEVFDQFGPCHADAGVGDGERFGRLVGGDADLQLRGGIKDVVFRQLRETHLFHRIRRIGDEFAQEDLAVGVERVDDDIEDLFDFGLEFVGLAHGGVECIFEGLGARRVAGADFWSSQHATPLLHWRWKRP